MFSRCINREVTNTSEVNVHRDKLTSCLTSVTSAAAAAAANVIRQNLKFNFFVFVLTLVPGLVPSTTVLVPAPVLNCVKD